MTLTDDKLRHMRGVAEQCYKYATMFKLPEMYCKVMYFTGFNHDIGYAFLSEKNKNLHHLMGSDILGYIGCNPVYVVTPILLHGCSISKSKFDSLGEYGSIPVVILGLADLTVDSKGKFVCILNRLKDIEMSHGRDSDIYRGSFEFAKVLVEVLKGLISKEDIERIWNDDSFVNSEVKVFEADV